MRPPVYFCPAMKSVPIASIHCTTLAVWRTAEGKHSCKACSVRPSLASCTTQLLAFL